MNEQLRVIIDTQKLDTRILGDQERIRQIPLKISAMEQPLKETRATIEERQRQFEAAKKKRRDGEGAVEDIDARIEKLKARTTEIKTNKEYTALLAEIEAAEQEKVAEEDNILELMELVENESGSLKEAEAALKAQEAEAEKLKKELEAEVKEAEKDVETLREQRATLVSDIDPDTYKEYMKVLEAGNGLAVVRAESEICQGCNMNIMPQLFVRIRTNDELIPCPQCRRFLYFEEAPPGE